MKELHEQQAADEFRPLKDAEIADVSGALIIDMGLFGELEFHPGGCVTWAMYDADGSWIARGQC